MCCPYYFPTGRGAITINEVTLQSSSFTATPPTFTLYGNTSGGPPVEYTWTRNGAVITNNDSYIISVTLNYHVSTGTRNLLSNAFYRSILIVTGVLPGVYQYSVNNKATPTSMDENFNIEGNRYTYTAHYYHVLFFHNGTWLVPLSML